MMFWVHLLVVLVFIFIGARKGGIAIGFAGGAGVLALGLLGAPVAVSTHKPEGDVSYLPLDVIAIIMAVIVAIAAMQVAGGMDALVDLAERILRKNPKHLSFLAPVVTYFLTLMAGTGHTAFSMMPVITEVAKENDIRPSRPLSIAVVSSQIAITASPISAAVVFLSSTLEKKGIDYLQILAVSIPTTFVACMLTAGIMLAWDKMRHQTQLSTLPEYQQRKAAGLVAPTGREEGRVITWAGKRSVAIFLLGLLAVMAYSTAISDKVAGVRRFGSAALDLAWVAAGRFDAFWERGLQPWDIAAGIVLVREAGGFVRGLDGTEPTHGDILAGNASLTPQFADVLAAAK